MRDSHFHHCSYGCHFFVYLKGELKLTTIQKNVKQSIKDEFSLFCLGIGFDVDYDFLQRIATDNRGMAQRIFGNQETSAQMKVHFLPIAYETEDLVFLPAQCS